MILALRAYLDRVQRTGDHELGVRIAAERQADQPWEVVRNAGLLARCDMQIAEDDLGLDRRLMVRKPAASSVIARVPRGSPYPVPRHPARRARGAFDTPVEMARRVVAAAVAAADKPKIGLDPACGAGAFLLAMHEAGVEVWGTDNDPLALAVARIAVPKAKIELGDALRHGEPVDLVCGNPPFVPPERQDKEMRMQLRRRFPWLKGRFDLVIPFAAVAVDRVKEGGAVGLVLPAPALVQPYGATLRRRWAERHHITELSGPHQFPGASVLVHLVVMQKGAGPAPFPVYGIAPDELLRLDNVPFNPDLMPGDVELVESIRSRSTPLGELCLVDTGVVAHGSEGGKDRLIHDEPGEGYVPYADARDFFAGKRRWLDYQPDLMHRPKKPSMFEKPKIVIQRIRGKQAVRASIDWDGVYVGHTCTVVQPRDGNTVPVEQLLKLIRSPIIDGITRIERGERLDLYPRDVAAFPVPKAWLKRPKLPVEKAFNLSHDELDRLRRLAAN